jgi:putative membrane protein
MLLDKKIPFTYIINKVRVELIYILLIGVIVNYITREFVSIIPAIPIVIPTFLGTAISVILSFKLSQSYDRWWEARKIWGSIVNDSRNLVLQLMAFVKEDHKDLIKSIGLRQIAWCYSLGQSLRGLDGAAGLQPYIADSELTALQKHANKPLGLIKQHVSNIRELHEKGQLDLYSYVQLSTILVSLTNSMGMAERIKSTVFPVTYRLFLHMIIYVFIITLSIALRNLESYIEIPLLVVVAVFFFLLERTAAHLQDPFSNKPTDTAMTAIATTVEINIKQLLNLDDVPEPYPPNGFYLC